jgi:FkbM family methyltransferase
VRPTDHSNTAPFGALAPDRLDRLVMALTKPLPDTYAGLRLAILLRRAVTMRLAYPDGALDVERWGLRLRLHPRDNGCEKNLLFTPRMYEPEELAALEADIAQAKAECRPFTFVDIGANVGLFSFFVAARAGSPARILAIEPEPGNPQRLQFNIGANPGVPIKAIAKALSDEAGIVAVELNCRDRGGTRTRKLDQGGVLPETVRVPAITLLQLLTDDAVDAVDALKIDVEGLEDVILQPFFRDAPQRLWPRLAIIEDSRAGWKSDLMAAMAARGYRLVTRSRHTNLIMRRAP